MTALGDRHSGDLGGQLSPGTPTVVSVHLSDNPTVSDQHTTWMLLNLLLRLEGVVDRVILVGWPVGLARRISPHFAEGTSFAAAATDLASHVGNVPLELEDRAGGVGMHFNIGPGPSIEHAWRVSGHGWQATLSTGEVPEPAGDTTLPFGPYAAACLASAEVFRTVRLPSERYTPVSSLNIDLWNSGVSTGVAPALDLAGVRLDFGLAGVGAVGVAALNTWWACDALTGLAVIADNDANGIDDTNLNRYVLFDHRHVGLPKAATACEIYGFGQLEIHPLDGPYEREQVAKWSPRVLLSAVDTNESRRDLQRAFAPGTAFGASTEGLRAELMVLGPAGEGPCLACHNKVLEGIPDEVTRRQVRVMTDTDLLELAAATQTSPDVLRHWAQTGACGLVNEAALGHLLTPESQQQLWSVGFVSVFAGLMLAGQTVKHALRVGMAPFGTSSRFQFRQPQAIGNGKPRAVQADPACAVCANEVHRDVWARHGSAAHASAGEPGSAEPRR
jgi:molybdopterin/thiamine biosynthesis adenylyltransferase